MNTLENIRRPVEADLHAFEAFMAERFVPAAAKDGLLGQMLGYALDRRGKAIRPLLVCLSAALHSPTRGLRVSLAAMLVEMIHTASLIHDDVIDEAALRRGRASVNARWQSRNAVVLGDYILSRSMDLGLQSAQFDLVSHVCRAMGALCEGEILQNDRAQSGVVSREAYLEVIHKKTASLLGVSASAGALAVGAGHERIESMRRFGQALGMAFQIQDDILDFAPARQTGKPSGGDLREGKATLPLIEVLERRPELAEWFDRARTSEQDAAELCRIVRTEGGLERAAQIARQYVDAAMAVLADYPESPARDALANLCLYITEREK